MLHPVLTISSPTAKLDISFLLKSSPSPTPTTTTTTSTISSSTTTASITRSVSIPIYPTIVSSTSSDQTTPSTASQLPPQLYAPTSKRRPPTNPHESESPSKKQTKWSAEEDARIIELRGSGMKWDDIAKRIPDRSPIGCRLHYQNYLERRSVWDDEKKTRLARVYERMKPEIWNKVGEELGVPWRAAEAMHWIIGEEEMARRAGVVAFTMLGPEVGPGGATEIGPPGTRAKRRGEREGGSQGRGLPSLAEVMSTAPAFAEEEMYRPGYVKEEPGMDRERGGDRRGR